MSPVSIDEAIAEFRESSIAATRLQKAGERVAGNKKRDRSHAAYTRLLSEEGGREALIGLLDDPDPNVRHDVAGRLLPDPKAVAALESWAAGEGPEAEAARFTLKYFRMEQGE